ncbi:MAG: asparagine synthase (glutamine-hydrolyzing), partial [Thermodesulfobacteriota bacterium]
MCGICGKIFFEKGVSVDPKVLRIMTDALNHRGPDDEGMYISQQVGLGHKRLSIIDLNVGKQPISNENGTVWVVYNGEIYNYKELRVSLLSEGHIFKTETDTEVIVHLYEKYGEECVSRLRGMFSFALWDERAQFLLLARDRVGIKPLYYSLTRNSLVFASEIKAILADPSVKSEVNIPVIDRFLTYFYTPGQETMFKNISKLRPGHFLTLKNGKVDLRRYWDLHYTNVPPAQNCGDAVAKFQDLLRNVVQEHMVSDVPVGVLLSGGIDSTALLSLAVEGSQREISTFTIGFDGKNLSDERTYAKLAAKQFGTKHYDMTITSDQFRDFIPKYIWHMEEPVCEPPAIALYYISKLAKEHVKVLISGEGGDEVFAGYQIYRNIKWLEQLKKILGPLNSSVSKLVNHFSGFVGSRRLQKYSSFMTLPLESYYYSQASDRFTFFNNNYNELYSKEFRHHIHKNYSTEILRLYYRNVAGQDILNKMLYIDMNTWLPDDLLIKADKITMANSIELRVPLLDHRVLEFGARLPTNYKIRGTHSKYILKKAFHSKVPKEILRREKMGFPVPYEAWLRN